MKNPFLKPKESAASFLPQDYVARKNELRANLICLSLFGVVMFCVVSAFFVTNRQWLQVKRQQDTVRVQFDQESVKIEQFKRLEAQKSEMMDKAEITAALLEKIPRSTLISELVTRMPGEITLLEMHLVSKRIKEAPPPAATPGEKPKGQIKSLGGNTPGSVATAKGVSVPPPAEKVAAPRFEYTLKLIGVAKVNNNIADYLQALKACTILDNVDLKYINETTIEKLDLRKFEIEATLSQDVDARGIAKIEDLRAATPGGLPGDDPKRATVLLPEKPADKTTDKPDAPALAGEKED